MGLEKHYKIVIVLILSAAILFIILTTAWYLLAKKLPEVIENLSAKHETIKELKTTAEIGRQKIIDIENRISREEDEYNEAKRQEELKRRQYDILAFENSLATVEAMAKDAYLNQEKIIAQWKMGSTTNGNAYEATNSAKEQCEKVKKEIRFIRVPENLPVPVGELLAEARSELAASYSKKVEALEYLLRFIDDDKPSYQHKFNEGLRLSREFSANATLDIIEAKRKAGIDLFKGASFKSDESTKAKCSYTISGIFYSEKNPFVFINEKVYYINDPICTGKVARILPNRVIIRFPDGDKEHRVGEAAVK